MKRFPATFFVLLVSIAVQALLTAFPQLEPTFSFIPSGGVLGWLGLIPHQLAHGSWEHLLGNFVYGLPFMLYLEHKLGRAKFLEFYLICGTMAALFQTVLGGFSGAMIGSSGAIMGVQAGACMLFGDSREEHILGGLYAALVLIPQLAAAPMAFLSGIAVYAHVGGFITGLFLSTKARYKCTSMLSTAQPALKS